MHQNYQASLHIEKGLGLGKGCSPRSDNDGNNMTGIRPQKSYHGTNKKFGTILGMQSSLNKSSHHLPTHPASKVMEEDKFLKNEYTEQIVYIINNTHIWSLEHKVAFANIKIP